VNQWINLSQSPQNGINTSDCLLQNKIVMTGYYCDGLYSDDDKADRYELVYKNISGNVKYVVHGSIVSDAEIL
jgi:hypothetical protein